MSTRRWAALTFALACLTGETALAATCHMTVQGRPVVDDQDCSVVRAKGGITIGDEAGDTIRIRRSTMSARFAPRSLPDGRRRRSFVSYGEIVVSSDSDEKTCYFNQKATLCLDP